jgi:hypothetical protein
VLFNAGALSISVSLNFIEGVMLNDLHIGAEEGCSNKFRGKKQLVQPYIGKHCCCEVAAILSTKALFFRTGRKPRQWLSSGGRTTT